MAKMVPTAAALAECPDGYDASKPPAQKSENVSSLMSTGNVDDVSGSGHSWSYTVRQNGLHLTFLR